MTDTLSDESITTAAQIPAPNLLPHAAPEAIDVVAITAAPLEAPADILVDTAADAPSDASSAVSADAAASVPADAPAGAPAESTPPAQKRKNSRPKAADSFPILEKLAAFYPELFGAVFLPLKRGIFQDLMAAHPDALDREALKGALALHTRSTRYLTTVAAGEKRHDLQGQPVEDMAPEHVYHSLLEVFRRRHNRTGEDVRPALRKRILQAFEASGMSKDAYVELVRSRDEAANTLLEEALAEAGARAAKDEALLRAFQASGQTVEAFADMYGMDARTVTQSLERARRMQSQPPAVEDAAGAEGAEGAAASVS